MAVKLQFNHTSLKVEAKDSGRKAQGGKMSQKFDDGTSSGFSFNATDYAAWGDTANGAGVIGASDRGTGVRGYNKGRGGVYIGPIPPSAGVIGVSEKDDGVVGYSQQAAGVFGKSDRAGRPIGEAGVGEGGIGVFGVNDEPGGIGVRGRANGEGGQGISGIANNGMGVSGTGSILGVFGQSDNGNGVSGQSENGVGVSGWSLKIPS